MSEASRCVPMLASAAVSPARSAEFLGVWRLIADAGGVLAPAVVGGVAQALTLGTAFLATASFGVAGALVMAWVVPEGLAYAARARDGAREIKSQDL